VVLRDAIICRLDRAPAVALAWFPGMGSPFKRRMADDSYALTDVVGVCPAPPVHLGQMFAPKR
jgi:hypothetical protein